MLEGRGPLRRCAVTGATGLVGDAVVRRLVDRGWDVRRLSRGGHTGEITFTLGRPVPREALADVDALVHCAHDWTARTPEAMETLNVQGSMALFESAIAAGVRRLVFISSVSAHPNCRSLYGRAKLAVEDFVRARGGVAIRPGLVWGDSTRGMFGALFRLARLPVLPVFDGGRQPFVLVHVDDLAALVERAADPAVGPPAQPVLAAHPETIPFAELLRRLARSHGRRVRLVPVPGTLGLLGLRMLEALGLRPRFRSDSLLGLLDARVDAAPHAREWVDIPFRAFRHEEV